MWILVVVIHRRFCYSTFEVLNTCRLRGQSTRGVKTDIKRQTFRVANFSSVSSTIEIVSKDRMLEIIGVDYPALREQLFLAEGLSTEQSNALTLNEPKIPIVCLK